MNRKIEILSVGSGGPYIYWGMLRGHDSLSEMGETVKALIPDAAFTLVAFEVEAWDAAFSPWEAPAVFKGRPFAGCGPQTLEWLKDVCIPTAELGNTATRRYIVGYSLAGLFALWALTGSKLFDGAASCSGSLWFPGWMDHLGCAEVNEGAKVYMSLGDDEPRTHNRSMSTIGLMTQQTFEWFDSRCKAVFEWNKGGHFADSTLRVAKAIARLTTE